MQVAPPRAGHLLAVGLTPAHLCTSRLTVRTPDRTVTARRSINSAPVPAAISTALMGSCLVYVATAVVARSRTYSAADPIVSLALSRAQFAASPILLSATETVLA